jgi:peptide deformylase
LERTVKCDVVKYGNDALRVKALPVEIVDENIRALASDMLETMYANSGVGLAAEQVGRTEAVFVIDVSPPSGSNHEDDYEDEEPENPDVPMPMVLINPEVLSFDGGQETAQEGCLSFPEIFTNITRPSEVTVAYTDLESSRNTITASGLLSRAIQHEMDHLNGVLLVDRMSHVQKISLSGKLRRLKKATQSA